MSSGRWWARCPGGGPLAARERPERSEPIHGIGASMGAAAVIAAAAERMDQHRKGDLVVQVVDAQGQPVRGAQVRVQMQRHAFSFGCVYNPRRIAGAAADDPESAIYRRKFVESFNEAVDE